MIRFSLLPTYFVLSGLMVFSNMLYAQQQTPALEKQQRVEHGESLELRISPSTIRKIQMKLNRLGFDAGNVDGIFGENTAEALANFQKFVGLEPTGLIDVKTLLALRIDIKSALY